MKRYKASIDWDINNELEMLLYGYSITEVILKPACATKKGNANGNSGLRRERQIKGDTADNDESGGSSLAQKSDGMDQSRNRDKRKCQDKKQRRLTLTKQNPTCRRRS